MARVNLEDRFFAESRLDTLTRRLGWKRRATIGAIADLWHNSQEALRTKGTEEELIEWARMDEEPDEGKRFVAALVRGKYIHAEGDEFVIHGNEAQIEGRVSQLKGSAKGGATTKAQWEKMKAELAATKAALEAATSEGGPRAMPKARPRAMPEPGIDQAQFKASQGNASQASTSQVTGTAESDESDQSPTFGVRELAALWNAKAGPMHPAVRIASLRPDLPRWRAALARLKEEPDPAYWEEVVTRFVAWPHGRGMTPPKNPGESPWVATFDFLVKPSTHVRAMEGEFTPRKGGAPPGSRAQRDAGMVVGDEVQFVMAENPPEGAP